MTVTVTVTVFLSISSRQFENTLKELKWGQNDDFNEDAFDTNLLNRAELLAEYLFLVIILII